MLRAVASLVLLSVPAAGQHSIAYDAGTAGNPPLAPDPVTQGWQALLFGVTGSGVSPDPAAGLNAWEVNDPRQSATGGYGVFLSGAAIQRAKSVGWELTAILRMTAGTSPGISLNFATGSLIPDSQYLVQLQIQGIDVVASNPTSGTPILCPGGADGGYHSFTLRETAPVLYGPAELVYDGAVLGLINEQIPLPCCVDRNVFWGGSPFGAGRGRFHRVEFRTLDELGTVHCTPQVPNSTGVPGGLAPLGSPYLEQNFLELTARDLPAQQFGYLLASLSAGFVAQPGGSQGNLCVAGNIGRYVTQIGNSGAGGEFTTTVDLTALPVNPPQAAVAGETWNFQVWYRDVNPQPTSNFTEARRITFR